MLSCGIDFGTSNSAIALHHKDRITLIPVEGPHPILPSALFYPVGKAPVYGRAAIQNFTEGEDGRFLRSLKRILGTTLMNYGTIVNDKPRRFDEIIGGFISLLKSKAEHICQQEIENVVMGRPVHFVDHDPDADYAAEEQLTRIAKHAGFKNVTFQFEPIAAAFAHEKNLKNEKLALVIDIGGGTSDFTVIRLNPSPEKSRNRQQDILGNSGTRIGGNDFDKDLSLSTFMPHFGYKTTFGKRNLDVPLSWFHDFSEWSKINFLYTPKFKSEINTVLNESNNKKLFGRYTKAIQDERGHHILSEVENCKIELTDKDCFEAVLPFIDADLKIPATRQSLETAIAERLSRILACMNECLTQSGLSAKDIELIVLTGGPAEMPVIKKMIQTHFPNAALSEDNKLSSVALGLGHDSANIFSS